MSIKRKLILMMMGVSLTAVMLTVVAVAAYLIYDMRQSKVEELQVTAAITGDRNIAPLIFGDTKSLQNNLEIFRLNPAVLASCIYNNEGALAAGYSNSNPQSTLACPEAVSTLPQALPKILLAQQAIVRSGDMVGTVFIASDTREIRAFVYKILMIAGTTIILVLGVMVPLTMYVQRTISDPILELAATAESITQSRDFSLEAKATYAAETGALARAFNAMLGEVRKRDRELIEANETLEQKVVLRTRELEDAKKKAEAASEAKSEFLRNMSHEFRTPLHAILSFSAYGSKEFEQAPRTELKQYFELIQKGSERLSRLVNEVLDLAKFEHGTQKLAMQKYDLCELVTRSTDQVKALLKDKSLTLNLIAPPAAEIVTCDSDKILQVLTNLLSNAIKFTTTGSRVTVDIHGVHEDTGGRHVLVSVIDEGIGIPEAEKETIFESFRQSSRTNTGAGGTGLGLAICRNIIKAHGGKIWAENNPDGKGARVTFSLPAIATAPQEYDSAVTLQTGEVGHERTT